MPPISILAQNSQSRPRVSLRSAKRRAKQILEILGCQDCQLSLVLADDGFVASLNERFRGVQGATDVLSFPQGPPDFPEVKPKLLGDLVISTETALRQAEKVGHSLSEEMDLLITHGLLHLLGYDHEASRRAAREMKAREKEILLALEPA